MALPKIGVPQYQLELISGRRIEYRPFTVKEEKILLMANESKDQKNISNAIRTVLNQCIIHQEGQPRTVVEDLPMFDVEQLFLHIRMKSVGEMSDFNVVCEDCEGSPSIKTRIDLNKVRVENSGYGKSEKIMLTSDIGVEMMYPPFKSLLEVNPRGEAGTDDPLMALEMIPKCILTIYDEKQVYQAKDFSNREIDDFVESLTQEHLKKLNEFFERMPRLVYDLKVECPCGQVMEKKLQGISDFFT